MSSKKENGGCSLLILMLLAFCFGHSMRQKEVNRERMNEMHEVIKERNQRQQALRDAAEKGDANAQFELGQAYETRLFPDLKFSSRECVLSEASEWYQKAAAQGHEEAQKALKRLKRMGY